jgi:hypothetical protein
MSGQTKFSTEYIVSLLAGLLVTYGVAKGSPNLNPMVTYVIVPLLVSYITLQVLNALLPGLNRSGAKVSAYVENKTLGEINNMGYIQIFPPLLAITILVFVLLFTNKLA